MWAVQGTVCGTASALPPAPTQCCGRRPDWPLPLSKRKFCKPQRPLWMCSLFRHHLFQQDNSCSGSPKASSFPKVIPQSFKKKKKKKNHPGKNSCPCPQQSIFNLKVTQFRANFSGIPRSGTFLARDCYVWGLSFSHQPH